MSAVIRVLIVDDSAMVRRIIATLLTSDPAIQVVGEARNGVEAIKLTAELKPDIITMDVRMPQMDGLQATQEIMAYYPTPILVLTASLGQYEGTLTFQMLNAGALEVLEKPRDLAIATGDRSRQMLLDRIKVLSRVRVVTHLRGRRRKSAETQIASVVASKSTSTASTQPANCLVILGASTGGPRVLYKLLQELPPNFPAAILIVQHIAEGFVATMVDWLKNSSSIPVDLAHDNAILRAGCALVAPDTAHIRVDKNWRVLFDHEPHALLYPSIDIAMQTAAQHMPSQTIGVVLTGMGRDGAKGLVALRKAGGITLAQDQQSSAIWGMPRAAYEDGGAMELIHTDQLAQRLVQIVTKPPLKK